MRHILRIVVPATLALLVVAGPASAAAPLQDHVVIDDRFTDEFLSDACGVEVTAHFTGHIGFRAWFDEVGEPLRERNTFALSGVYSSANGAVRVRDVGVDRVTYEPDGFVNVIVGNVQSIQVPGKGRVYSDVGQTTLRFTLDEAGQIVDIELVGQAGQHDDDQTEALCGILG